MFHNHISRNSGGIVQERIESLKIGQKMQDLPEDLWHRSFKYYVKEDPDRKGGPNLRMIRLDPSKPSLTVTGFVFNKFVHPYADRFITVREAARLQGLPDELEFKGSLTSTQQQVGNAVPVELATAVFGRLLEHAVSNGRGGPLSAFSLFSGAGGLDIGAGNAENGGCRIGVPLAMDSWKDACDTLSGYKGASTAVRQQDITEVGDPLGYWRENTGIGASPDIVFGGPPCQAFSQAGKQKALCDPRGTLIFEFLRFVGDIRPDYFVMENVPNIASVDKGGLLRQVLEHMRGMGYNVSSGVLCAADYGTPQMRKRMIFIGCDKRLGHVGLPPVTHCPSSNILGLPAYRTVGDAFDGIPLEARPAGAGRGAEPMLPEPRASGTGVTFADL